MSAKSSKIQKTADTRQEEPEEEQTEEEQTEEEQTEEEQTEEEQTEPNRMTNFNFKKDWEQLCMPLVRTNRMHKAMKKGVLGFHENSMVGSKVTEEYRKEQLRKHNLKKNDYPLNHIYCDAFCNADQDIEDRIVPLLKKKKVLKEDENAPRSEDFKTWESFDDAFGDYFESRTYEKYQKYLRSVIQPYMDVERMKNYKYFCLYGGCHWWNPTFGITLASMVMPSIKWKIIKGEYHTTVASHDENLVFDILYFDEKDTETFGGREALMEAKKKK